MSKHTQLAAAAAATFIAAAPASAQSVREFVVRVPEPNFVLPGLEANPQPEVDARANFRTDNSTRVRPRMSRSERRQLADRCREILDNPRSYSRDAVSLCREAFD